ncbi:MAG: hypothetical protein C7B44_02620 [Sulfobacillus thermosulfidooxidans]|uniref:peptidylprolyl isomerase n=1 Tax=Sulfobacillus TaxID=28033 RepID=UPI000CD25921|nr:peptidylprolyl isomerase [Sulfobacillus sp. hq2]POB09945.1 hypothetical protein CO251_12055 [Sulfobacillus sp. hq2]PSR37663.1 MAG: hypothetical protein C7B44_02620 [Sulfobacillus thermosulfidooxidans]
MGNKKAAKVIWGLALGVALAGCGSSPSQTLAIVNGEKITQAQWDTILRSNALMTGQTPNFDPRWQKPQLSTYANQLAIIQYSQHHHWLTPQAATTQASATIAQAVRAHFGNRAALFAVLHRYQIGPGDLMSYVKSQMWLMAAFHHVTQKVPAPSATAVQAFYAHHLSEFQTPKEVLAREIVLPSSSQAASVMYQWTHGAHFAALAQKYSIDRANRMAGGTMGWVWVKGDVTSPSQVFLAEHSPGHSGIVHTRLGYAIIEVQAVQGGTPLPLSTAFNGAKEQLWQASRSNVFDQWSAPIIRRAHVTLL